MEHAEHSPFAEPSGDACDSYHRWREDLDLVAGAGLNTYRFSLEWSRIEPEEGEFSRAALDHYRRIIDGCRDAGPNPLVTLVHFTMPRWLMHDGGWTGPKAGDRLARFAEFAAPALTDAEYVATINEPNLMAAQPVLGGMAMRGEPIHGLPRPDQGVAEALLGLHDRAREVFRGAGLRTGMTLIGRENIAEDGGEERMREERAAFEDQFLQAADGDDFLGLQVYTCARFGPDGLVAAGAGAADPGPRHGAPSGGPRRGGLLRRRRCCPASRCWSPRTASPRRTTTTASGSPRTPCAACPPRSPAAPTSAATCTGACSTTSSGCWATGPPSAWSSVDRETFVRTPKPSLAWLGEVARRNGLA